MGGGVEDLLLISFQVLINKLFGISLTLCSFRISNARGSTGGIGRAFTSLATHLLIQRISPVPDFHSNRCIEPQKGNEDG